MLDTLSPLNLLEQRLAASETTPQEVGAAVLACSNTNAGRNVYLKQDASVVQERAELLAGLTLRPDLYSVPISIKDCFDVRGLVTTCGSAFYAAQNAPATEDSWVAARLRQAGALIPGKTNMHPLAYGITGQNAEFGDCLQPRDSNLLTGGSSSGAAASVQEGSALAAIGTDTGGSIRVPAALCGVAGYRASIDLGTRIGQEIWRGSVHLAPSFDTLGFLFRDLRDGMRLATAIFGLEPPVQRIVNPRVAVIGEEFLGDCEPQVLEAYGSQQDALRDSGASLHIMDTSFWKQAFAIFAPIQAYEAARIQRAKLDALGVKDASFSMFEATIAERLVWGESLAEETILLLRRRHADFQAAMDTLLTEHDLLLLPCAPTGRLEAAADHSQTRANILRYTTPISLSGMPTVTVPSPTGIGMQVVAARGQDAALLAYTARMGNSMLA
jgi:Asp-tRNA(Asn)/Glu-tRNA(Gln) amidotransferase A subunit family amidase